MCAAVFSINITSSYMFQPRQVVFMENGYLHVKVLRDS
jgi:hypothetical protein